MSYPDESTLIHTSPGNDRRVDVQILERPDKKQYYVRVLIDGKINDAFDTETPTLSEAMSILRGYCKFIRPI